MRGVLETWPRKQQLVVFALTVADRQPEHGRKETQDVIAILGQKGAEVMARNDAGNFIHVWQQLRDQVRQTILQDPRCQPIKAQQLSMLPS